MKPANPPSSPAPAPVAGRPLATPAWVPVRTLAPRHRTRVLKHLLALDEHDRYLRFGHAAGDAQIERYVHELDFERDELCGIFNRRLQLVAVAHLAFDPRGGPAEFGVSVLTQARGRGLGGRLFGWAMLHARNRGVGTLVVHALSENAAMLRIARRAGARVVREGPEAHATLQLPQDTFASRLEQHVGRQAAEVDYVVKRRARQWDGWMAALAGLKAAHRRGSSS